MNLTQSNLRAGAPMKPEWEFHKPEIPYGDGRADGGCLKFIIVIAILTILGIAARVIFLTATKP